MTRHRTAWLIPVCLLTFAACDLKRPRAVFAANGDTSQVEDVRESPAESNSQESKPDQSVPIPSEASIPRASPELLRVATSSTVRLVLGDADGSGVILGQDDEGYVYVLTVWHAANKRINRIEFFNFDSFPRPSAQVANSELVSHSERLDLAVVRVKATEDLKVTAVPLKSSTDGPDPRIAYSSGCGLDEFPTLLTERIIRKGRFVVRKAGIDPTRPEAAAEVPARLMWVTERPQEQGRSGGPLMNLNGELIGLALGRQGSSGYYCHFQEICDYLIDSNLKWLVRCDASGN